MSEKELVQYHFKGISRNYEFLESTKKRSTLYNLCEFFYIFEAEIYQAFRDNPQTTCLSSDTDHFSSDTVCFLSDTAG